MVFKVTQHLQKKPYCEKVQCMLAYHFQKIQLNRTSLGPRTKVTLLTPAPEDRVRPNSSADAQNLKNGVRCTDRRTN
jgi:hypothetical protein